MGASMAMCVVDGSVENAPVLCITAEENSLGIFESSGTAFMDWNTRSGFCQWGQHQSRTTGFRALELAQVRLRRLAFSFCSEPHNSGSSFSWKWYSNSSPAPLTWKFKTPVTVVNLISEPSAVSFSKEEPLSDSDFIYIGSDPDDTNTHPKLEPREEAGNRKAWYLEDARDQEIDRKGWNVDRVSPASSLKNWCVAVCPGSIYYIKWVLFLQIYHMLPEWINSTRNRGLFIFALATTSDAASKKYVNPLAVTQSSWCSKSKLGNPSSWASLLGKT